MGGARRELRPGRGLARCLRLVPLPTRAVPQVTIDLVSLYIRKQPGANTGSTTQVTAGTRANMIGTETTVIVPAS